MLHLCGRHHAPLAARVPLGGFHRAPKKLEKMLRHNAVPPTPTAPPSASALPLAGTSKNMHGEATTSEWAVQQVARSHTAVAFLAMYETQFIASLGAPLARHPFIVMVGFPVPQSILTVAFANSRVNTAAEDPPPCVHTPCGSPKSVWYSGGNG